MPTTPDLKKGDFTLPGESGYEDLTLRLAEKWGADTIRDSDGTALSPEILNAGYDIYSTLCLPRAVNAWAKQHPETYQQNFLMSFPAVAGDAPLSIDPIAGYFKEQFAVNKGSTAHWQVFDRTSGEEVPRSEWSFDASTGLVTIPRPLAGHSYTVNFLAWRIWEEISMYNHITNNWGDREHLLCVDPIYRETREYLLEWLDKWLTDHPHTDVVRLTSMFYNFTWFWGDDLKLRYIYSDWADYAMTVSPESLRLFEQKYGYKLESEDFVNGGLYNCTHNAPSPRYRDYMDFMQEFVAGFGKECIDLVHKHGKKAYVFYDDSWVGVEPYGKRFQEFGFDGIIKCVFNAFEARKCAGVQGVSTRELRLHPYLFPTGLKGEPTFKPGGNPALDAKTFWVDTRRALLRAPVDRIGLGGYLHLVEPYPDFCDTIESIASEFRLLKSFHRAGAPYSAPCRVAVLTAWGHLRSWIASGHFTRGLEYNELLESLAGLPLDVRFIDFEDIRSGALAETDVLINCGREGSAWSGGHLWSDPDAVAAVASWVGKGGGLVGIAEPSAAPRPGRFFQLADVLGVDRDAGDRIGHGRYAWALEKKHFITEDLSSDPDFGPSTVPVYSLGRDTIVLSEKAGAPAIAAREFGAGRSVYFCGFKCTPENTRLLHRAILWAGRRETDFRRWTCSNVFTECAYFPATKSLVAINNSGEYQATTVYCGAGETVEVNLPPHGIQILSA